MRDGPAVSSLDSSTTPVQGHPLTQSHASLVLLLHHIIRHWLEAWRIGEGALLSFYDILYALVCKKGRCHRCQCLLHEVGRVRASSHDLDTEPRIRYQWATYGHELGDSQLPSLCAPRLISDHISFDHSDANCKWVDITDLLCPRTELMHSRPARLLPVSKWS